MRSLVAHEASQAATERAETACGERRGPSARLLTFTCSRDAKSGPRHDAGTFYHLFAPYSHCPAHCRALLGLFSETELRLRLGDTRFRAQATGLQGPVLLTELCLCALVSWGCGGWISTALLLI